MPANPAPQTATPAGENRFLQWATETLAAQCRMQARENLDPEYTQFMEAVAHRLAHAKEQAAGVERAAFIRLLDAADRYNGVHSQSRQPMARMQGDLILAVQHAYRVLGIGRTEKQEPLAAPGSSVSCVPEGGNHCPTYHGEGVCPVCKCPAKPAPASSVPDSGHTPSTTLGAYIGVTSAANSKYPDASEVAGRSLNWPAQRMYKPDDSDWCACTRDGNTGPSGGCPMCNGSGFLRGESPTVHTPASSVPDSAQLVEALRHALDHYERNICHHDDTYRGGSIWTICRDCGRKWADDEGGFVPFSYPPEIERGFTLLAALSAASGEGER